MIWDGQLGPSVAIFWAILSKVEFPVVGWGGVCTSCQLASNDTNRSWVGSRDSKGDEQSYLDYST